MSPPLSMPHDGAAERALIACMVLDHECIADVADTVSAEDFYAPVRAKIFDAILRVHSLGKGVETSLVLSDLESHGADHVAFEELMACTSITPVQHAAYAARVRKLSVARRIMRTALEVAADGSSPIGDVDVYLDETEAKLRAVCDQREDDTQIITLGDAIAEVFTDWDARSKNPGHLVGVPSGIDQLDRMLCGFQPGKVYLIAGRPGMGKTAAALQFAEHSAETTGKYSVVFSLEMLAKELATRSLSARSGVDSRKLNAADALGRDDGANIARAANAGAEVPLLIPKATSLTSTAIRRIARKLHARHGTLGLLAVDYMQLVTTATRKDNREQEVAEISRSFKLLALELEVPIIVCSQLNRGPEARADKRPMLSDLRESGSIEQDADVVLFVYRDEMYNKPKLGMKPNKGVAEFIVAKHRGGPTGTIDVVFDAPTTSFRSAAHHSDADAPHWSAA